MRPRSLPAEVAVHPSDKNDVHEFCLMTDDVHGLVAELGAKNIECSPIREERWGSLIQVTMPSGSKLGVYQPKHASPSSTAPAKKSAKKKVAPKRAKKAPKKVTGKKRR